MANGGLKNAEFFNDNVRIIAKQRLVTKAKCNAFAIRHFLIRHFFIRH